MKKHKMIKEIKQTPDVMREFYLSERNNLKEIAQRIRSYKPSFAVLAGRGSSDNACVYGQYVLEFISGLPVSLATGSIYTLYKKPPDISHSFVIGLSQSGETDDVCAIVEQALNIGAMSIGITNSKESRLYNLTKGNNIYLSAGKEESVCATKSFSSSILALLMLASSIKDFEIDLSEVIEPINRALLEESHIEELTRSYIYCSSIVVLGTGFSYSIALEAALKLRESCYLNAIGMSSVDFLHGSIAMLTSSVPVIMFMPDDETLNVNLFVLRSLEKIGTHVLVVSDSEEVLKKGDLGFKISKSRNFIYPFSEVIFSQLFSYHLSVLRGNDPDKPRYLNKVTKVKF